MAKNFERLRGPVMADPERRARIEQQQRAIEDALALAALREAQHRTQQEVAETLGVSQANISRIEHQSDVYLSTLSHYVEALGGRLEVTAVFPDGSIALLEPESERD